MNGRPTPGRIVESAEYDQCLSSSRGFLVVSEHGRELGPVSLGNLAAAVANAHRLTRTNNLLAT